MKLGSNLRGHLLLKMALAMIVLTVGSFSYAQKIDYPTKPIHIIVTFPPGGSSDAMVRQLVPRLSERLGQQIVIENKPGAGGNIGLTALAKAAPDGYTLAVAAAGALSANVSLYPQMPFDPIKDIKPITMMATIPFVLVGNPSLPAKNIGQLLAMLKLNPENYSIAHGGNGTAMHLTSALFNQMANTKIVEVPYRGTGPAVVDVLSGQVPLGIADLPSSLQQIKAGKLRAYAVTSAKRLEVLPDVPTLNEAGLKGYESVGWFGIVAPAGTPTPIINLLNKEITATHNEEAIKVSLRNLGLESNPSTVAAFEAYIKSEIVKSAEVIKFAKIKLD